ncbi:MAG: hypothetical protein S4CHLAM81_02090 [Chlamydiales bacterium]|nr:hypothetical protein [Chlamydiales bacterium]MCH9635003.1 hypothetical protein [Chlamydiales bacterium]MCH9703729.1 hypothetical protein [Chlamydiota bacterium]
MRCCVALFGEAEKGEYRTAYHCQDLADLATHLGEPPTQESLGLHFAIQSLLYSCPVVFFRVKEEGFSEEDYLFGLDFLQDHKKFPKISALGMPGVGERTIIEATKPVCSLYSSLLILNERDLYDYLTSK